MKANELMIGDWVRRRWTCTDTGREVVRDFQVVEVRKNGEMLYVWSEDGNMGAVEKIEPIPLTPEILEKNGFRDISDHTLNGAETYRLTMGEYCEIKITYKLGYYFAYDYYDDRWYRQFETSLCYRWCVHNLQHALRLCGIDKEITL